MRFFDKSNRATCFVVYEILPGKPHGTDGIHRFFTVLTASFRVLFVFIVLSHLRCRVLHFQVTEHPSQAWTMQQMREAFPWDRAPKVSIARS